MVIMDVGVPRALVRVLYDCVCEDLVIQFSVVTSQDHIPKGPENSQFTLMGKSCRGGAPRVACFYECPG